MYVHIISWQGTNVAVGHNIMGGLIIDLTSIAIALLLKDTLSYKTNLIQIHQLLRYFTKYEYIRPIRVLTAKNWTIYDFAMR